MPVSIDDQLQSVSGDLLGARVAIDAEWSETMEQHHYGEFADSSKYVNVVRLLTTAQGSIDKARRLLGEIL